jgi:uncharacterized protein (TIGR02246 family)
MKSTMTLTRAERQELTEIPLRFAQAWNRKDVDAVFADYADDADFVNVAGIWWQGKHRFVKEHADRFPTVFAASTLSIIDVKVRDIPPNAAVVHGAWWMRGHRKPDGRPAPIARGF